MQPIFCKARSYFSDPAADFPYYPEPKRGTFFARQAEKTHEK